VFHIALCEVQAVAKNLFSCQEFSCRDVNHD
jgi:hypothetical protein